MGAALTLTSRTADTLTATSLDLEVRLPVTARAQHAGLIDFPRARLIAEMTRVLSDADAGRVEALIFPKAAGQTTGQLRAALAGYGLPPVEVLAADQRLTDRASALR